MKHGTFQRMRKSSLGSDSSGPQVNFQQQLCETGSKKDKKNNGKESDTGRIYEHIPHKPPDLQKVSKSLTLFFF